MSGLARMYDYTYNYYTPTSTYFLSAMASDTMATTIFQSWSAYLSNYYIKTDSLFGSMGNSIKAVKFETTQTTNGYQDSLYILKTDNVYPSPSRVFDFPMIYGINWKTTYIDKIDFKISLVVPYLNKAPGMKKTFVSRTDSVIGWGDMIIPAPPGPGARAAVLMIKRVTKYIDSFYINGKPAGSDVLNTIGSVQGNIRIVNAYYFYRKNSHQPYLSMNFGSGEFVTPLSIIYEGGLTSDIDYEASENINIYPNPTSDRLSITHSKNMTAAISDIAGKIILIKKLYSDNETILLENIPNGNYILQLSGNNMVISRKIAIIK